VLQLRSYRVSCSICSFPIFDSHLFSHVSLLDHVLINYSHNKADCTEPPKTGGGGGGRECHNCKEAGHISRDCTQPKIFRCRNCDSVEHKAIDCPEPKDWSRVKCNNCKGFGHTVKRCKEPIVQTDGGEWGNDGGNSGDAAGGWTAGTDAPAAAGGGADWADEATAAAEGEGEGGTCGEGAASAGW
jgi:cellular nucleic acid-binding protein